MSQNNGGEREQLLTHAHQYVKQYIIYDGQNRPQKVYTATRTASVGDPCMVTEYIYVDPASTVMLARKEAPAIWDAANDGWDAGFTI